MGRELVWIEKERFEGWACSACGWEFRALRPLVGDTIEEMKLHFERERDEAFKTHACNKYPKRPAE
jgi:rubredoxin